MKKNLLLICFMLNGYFTFSQDNSLEYNVLIKKGDSLYQAKEYLKSALAFSSAFQLPGQEPPFDDRYTSACSWSLAGFTDSAFSQLYIITSSKKLNFNDVDDILVDKDFTQLHNDRRWQDVKNKMFSKAYGTFLTILREAGLKITASDSNRVARSLASANSVDQVFLHLNDPAYRLLKEKKYNDAYSYLKSSYTIFPLNYTFTRDIGDYYQATGDKTRAFVYYSRALDLKYYRALSDMNVLPSIDSGMAADYQEVQRKTGRLAVPTENLLFSIASQLMRKGFTDKAYTMHKLNIENHPGSFKATRGMSDDYNDNAEKDNADEYDTRSLL